MTDLLWAHTLTKHTNLSNVEVLHLHVSALKMYLECFCFFSIKTNIDVLGDEQKRKEIFENKKQQLTVDEIKNNKPRWLFNKMLFSGTTTSST